MIPYTYIFNASMAHISLFTYVSYGSPNMDQLAGGTDIRPDPWVSGNSNERYEKSNENIESLRCLAWTWWWKSSHEGNKWKAQSWWPTRHNTWCPMIQVHSRKHGPLQVPWNVIKQSRASHRGKETWTGYLLQSLRSGQLEWLALQTQVSLNSDPFPGHQLLAIISRPSHLWNINSAAVTVA